MPQQNYSVKVRFNRAIHKRFAGQIETVQAFKDGTPKDRLIRKRLADNDGSVEILKNEIPKPAPKAEEPEKSGKGKGKK